MPQSRTGRDHLEVGGERARRHLEAHLVVALAGAAVGDGVGAVLAGRRDEVLHDDRPRQRRHQRVAALVQRVGLQRGGEEVVGELLAGVDDDRLDRAGGERPLAHGVPVARPSWPTSTRQAITSTPSSSIIQRTATEVSRPPL